jgi:hypothetical protein
MLRILSVTSRVLFEELTSNDNEDLKSLGLGLLCLLITLQFLEMIYEYLNL